MSFVARLAVCCALGFGVGSAARAQPSYRLTCQGGPTLKVEARSWGNTAQITIEFARAARSSSEAHPLGGECAWSDRALGADEPTIAIGTFEGINVGVKIFGDGRLDRFIYGGDNVENLNRVSELLRRILSSQSFEIRVRAAGSGSYRHFEITHLENTR